MGRASGRWLRFMFDVENIVDNPSRYFKNAMWASKGE
jgi:hypothetical protein